MIDWYQPECPSSAFAEFPPAQTGQRTTELMMMMVTFFYDDNFDDDDVDFDEEKTR